MKLEEFGKIIGRSLATEWYRDDGNRTYYRCYYPDTCAINDTAPAADSATIVGIGANSTIAREDLAQKLRGWRLIRVRDLRGYWHTHSIPQTLTA